MKTLKEPKKDEDNYLLTADGAKELVDAVNAFIGLTVSPAKAGKLVINGGKAILHLKGLGEGNPITLRGVVDVAGVPTPATITVTGTVVVD